MDDEKPTVIEGVTYVCTLPAGTMINLIPGSNGCTLATHPDHPPLVIYPSGHTRQLEAYDDSSPLMVDAFDPFVMSRPVGRIAWPTDLDPTSWDLPKSDKN